PCSSVAWRRPVTITSLPSSRNLRAKARPIPAEPPVIRMVRPVSFITVLSYVFVCGKSTLFRSLRDYLSVSHDHRIISVILWMQKKSKAVQKMISYASQHSFPIDRLGKNAGYRYGSRHRTKNDEEVSLPLRCGPSRHELHPAIPFDQPGNSFSNTEFGAGHLRGQRRNRTASIRMITM